MYFFFCFIAGVTWELYTAVLSIQLMVVKRKENEINENLLDGSKFQRDNIKQTSA